MPELVSNSTWRLQWSGFENAAVMQYEILLFLYLVAVKTQSHWILSFLLAALLPGLRVKKSTCSSIVFHPTSHLPQSSEPVAATRYLSPTSIATLWHCMTLRLLGEADHHCPKRSARHPPPPGTIQTLEKIGINGNQYGFVWKCWVNIPNEIAIFHRDNDHENHWV